MAMNRIRFQPALSMPELVKDYGTVGAVQPGWAQLHPSECRSALRQLSLFNASSVSEALATLDQRESTRSEAKVATRRIVNFMPSIPAESTLDHCDQRSISSSLKRRRPITANHAVPISATT